MLSVLFGSSPETIWSFVGIGVVANAVIGCGGP